MKIFFYCALTFLLAVGSFLAGSYLTATQYQDLFVRPYLGDLIRDHVFLAMLVREGKLDPVYPENTALSYLRIADGLDLTDDNALQWVATYVDAYQVPVAEDLEVLLAPQPRFDLSGDRTANYLSTFRKQFLAGAGQNYLTEYKEAP